MTLACLYLAVVVMFPPVPPHIVSPVERYEVVECTRKSNMSTMPYASSEASECELEARRIVKDLQYIGILPGAWETISIKFACTNEV